MFVVPGEFICIYDALSN